VAMDKNAIVVLGMHRSGTSALTGVLTLLGADPGPSLIPAVEGINPKGFWEHKEIVSIHDQLLEEYGTSWDDGTSLPSGWWLSSITMTARNKIISIVRRDFSASPLWIIKDPRMCRLLPLWHEVLRELALQPLFVISVRNPAEVARSLRKRDGLGEELSCLLWLTHILDAEFQTRGQRRVFVSYQNLLSNWRETMGNISQTLRVTWPVSIDDAGLSVDEFLDPALRHHDGSVSLQDHLACNLAQKAFELLSTQSPDPAELDLLRMRTDELVRLVAPWSMHLRNRDKVIRQHGHLQAQNLALEHEMSRMKDYISDIRSSFSWKLLIPVRILENLLRRTFSSSVIDNSKVGE